MFPNEKARLMRMMDSYGIPTVNESGAKMDFTQRVTCLIEHANQQSVQAYENTTEAFVAEFIEFINDAYLHEEDRQKILGFLRERSRR